MSTVSRARARLARRSRWPLLGLVGAMAIVAGVGGYLALLAPPYVTDESSHVGYTLSVRDGVLPDLDTRVPAEDGGPELEAAIARPWPFSVPEIHVANNPPFPYVAAVPLAELTDAAGVRGGPLLGVRLVNLLGGVAAVGMAGLLGRELGGRDALVGVATAGLVAGLVAIPGLSAVANLDGLSLLTTTGVAWALARLARTTTLRHAAVLGLWCAAAAATRPMALALAGVAGVVALVLVVRARGLGAAWRSAAVLALPTAVLVGWFYALNLHRYGDPTGSAAVFDRYGYEGTRSLPDILFGPEPFVQTFAYLVTEVYGERGWWGPTSALEWSLTLAAVLLVGAALVLAGREQRGGAPAPASSRGAARPLCLRSWTAVTVVALVPMVLIAQHMAGGGAGHARYLLPTVPVVAAALALVLVRLSPWLAVVAVAGAAVAHLLRARAAGEVHVADPLLTPPLLQAPLVGQPYRSLALLVAAAGALAVVVAMAGLARSRSRVPGADPVPG